MRVNRIDREWKSWEPSFLLLLFFCSMRWCSRWFRSGRPIGNGDGIKADATPGIDFHRRSHPKWETNKNKQTKQNKPILVGHRRRHRPTIAFALSCFLSFFLSFFFSFFFVRTNPESVPLRCPDRVLVSFRIVTNYYSIFFLCRLQFGGVWELVGGRGVRAPPGGATVAAPSFLSFFFFLSCLFFRASLLFVALAFFCFFLFLFFFFAWSASSATSVAGGAPCAPYGSNFESFFCFFK